MVKEEGPDVEVERLVQSVEQGRLEVLCLNKIDVLFENIPQSVIVLNLCLHFLILPVLIYYFVDEPSQAVLGSLVAFTVSILIYLMLLIGLRESLGLFKQMTHYPHMDLSKNSLKVFC